MLFYFDPRYLLFVLVPTLIISAAVQWYLKATFNKWRQIRNSAGLTGAQIADELFARAADLPRAEIGRTGETGARGGRPGRPSRPCDQFQRAADRQRGQTVRRQSGHPSSRRCYGSGATC